MKVLTLENPAYFRICRITGSDFAAQRNFKYYKQSGGDLIVPRGFADRFIGYLDKNKIEYELETDFVKRKMKDSWSWKQLELRDYQKPILDKVVDKDVGIIHASVGSGKTVMACWLTKHFGLTTTILVPNTIIQKQFISEFKKWFNYDVGIINGKEKNIKDVTVSTFQSLSANKELCKELSDNTSILIIDECHGITARGRVKVLEMFRPLKLFGLSGSPRKSKDNGQTNAIFFYLGQIIAEHKMPMVTPRIEVIRTESKIMVDDYHAMIDKMIVDDNRNTLIIGLIVMQIMSGHKILVLCKRVEHCKILKEKLSDFGDAIYHADVEDKERNEVLMSMRNGKREFSAVIGTFQLLGQGCDVPSLDCLLIAGDLKTDVGLEQAGGRILRWMEGKENALIYDLFDYNNPILRRQGMERYRFYKSRHWELTGVDWIR
uniref:Putative type III restriction enzyme n=1 Tax=viral metagenome TaxID=1070528 RepID=A0A6H1ZS20_9ZZZZ